jgi:hypothetical protein
MMIRPEFGLCLPCRVKRIREAAVIDVTLPVWFGCLWVVHLENIVSLLPETPEGERALKFTKEVLDEANTDVAAWIPAMVNEGLGVDGCGVANYVAGDLWIGTEDRLSDILVNAGHAVRVKE